MSALGKSKTYSSFPTYIFPLIIFAIVFIIFRSSLANGFVEWDDDDYVLNNHFIRSFSIENIVEMFTNSHTGNWHPLTWVSHAIDYQLFGLEPVGHHFMGMVIHGFNSVWVYFIFIRLATIIRPGWAKCKPLYWGGLVTALLFGCHPLRVESVAWASERKDLLSAFFILPAFFTYLNFLKNEETRYKVRWYLITIILFILSLMSKPMVVTFPVLLLVFDAFILNRFANLKGIVPIIIEKIPFFIISLAFGIIAIFSQSGSGAMVSVETLTLDSRLLNAIRAIIFYINKTIWPQSLAPLYPFPKNLSLGDSTIIFAITVFLGITIICLKLWKHKKPFWAGAWLYYLISVLPIIGIIQVGRQGAADRYTYLPTLSFYLLLGGCVTWLLIKLSPTFKKTSIVLWGLIAGAIVLTGLAMITDKQIKVWENTETFSQSVIKVFPNQVPLAHFKLARVYKNKGWREKAKEEYLIALNINPNYRSPLNDLGLMALEEGKLNKAESYFHSGMKIQPDEVLSTNLGILFMRKKQYILAEEYLLKALSLNPRYSIAHNNLGMVYLHDGKIKLAENHYKSAIKINPDFIQAFGNLGVLYKNIGDLPNAEIAFTNALNIDSSNSDILNFLGEVYLQAGLNDMARIKFNEALNFNENHSLAKANLAGLASLENLNQTHQDN
ncbi:MAG: tetratricopeptide repeat protein [Nitrospinales bacterium]